VDDEKEQAAESPAETDEPSAAPHDEPRGEDEQPELVPRRRPIHRLGAIGCLGMALAVLAGIALLMTGNFFAGVAGIVIVAVAIGVGLWLYTVASLEKKE
jgi:hypothetical protein